jgi:hypothetical protein
MNDPDEGPPAASSPNPQLRIPFKRRLTYAAIIYLSFSFTAGGN